MNYPVDYIDSVICGDARNILAQMPDGVEAERDTQGRFVKGKHYSVSTEFQKGQHWRPQQPYWDSDYLYNHYVTLKKSANEIAKEHNCHRNNIIYWLDKHGIPKRTTAEARKVKYWGLKGKQNGMYGKTGENNPNWRGGVTPDRQALYSSEEWADAVKAAWIRDKATCQRCQRKASGKVVLHIHHIVSFQVAELRCHVPNLVLLCKRCHDYVHSKENTEGEFIGEA